MWVKGEIEDIEKTEKTRNRKHGRKREEKLIKSRRKKSKGEREREKVEEKKKEVVREE